MCGFKVLPLVWVYCSCPVYRESYRS